MSPEAAQSGQKVDARTDIWSLGVILFEALTGSRPFAHDQTETLTVILKICMSSSAPRVKDLDSTLSGAMDELIFSAMQKVASLAFFEKKANRGAKKNQTGSDSSQLGKADARHADTAVPRLPVRATSFAHEHHACTHTRIHTCTHAHTCLHACNCSDWTTRPLA